jgi:hypothetical protein
MATASGRRYRLRCIFISQQSIGSEFDRSERKHALDSLEMFFRENRAGFQKVATLAMLVIMYTMLKNQTAFDPNFEKNKTKK